MLSLIARKFKTVILIRVMLLSPGFVLPLASSVASAESFSDMVHDKDSWIYKKIHSTKDELMKKIEKEVNAAFKELVLDKMIKKMTEQFGEEMGKTLGSFIGIGPFFSFASLVANSSGPSETQIMMQILLEAINDARDEIIDAVEQNFQDETEADLNALILALDIYNSRNEDARKLEYQLLSDMSYFASRVKKRLEQKSSKAVDNSHLYMLISGLHVEIEKQYTHWLTLHVDPNASAEKLKSEFDSVLDVMVRDNFNFINEGTIGSVDTWRASFEASFDDKVEFAGYVPATEIPGGRTGKNAYYFSYKFNGKPLKFKVLGGNGCGQAYRNFYVYDAIGRQVGRFTGGCKTSESHQLKLVQQNIGMVINSHKSDAASFNKYVLDGYVPIREIFDLWWKMAFGTDRPDSEVDIFTDKLLAFSAPKEPSACAISGNAGDYVGAASGSDIPKLGASAATRCSPCGVFATSYDRGASVSFYCRTE